MDSIIPTSLDPQTPKANFPVLSTDRLTNLFTLQDFLNSKVSHTQAQFLAMSPKERAQWLINAKNAADAEFTEVLDHLDWKWWKTKPESLAEAQKEWIDRFHFILTEGLALGITPEILYEEYLRKNQVNHTRSDWDNR